MELGYSPKGGSNMKFIIFGDPKAKVKAWVKMYDHDLIYLAIRESLVFQKLSFAYINEILKSWKQKKLFSE